jgi:hydroxyacylglutathione hydrolase
LFKSAQQFLKLPEYLQVWPAHGAGSACGKALGAVPQSTVGYEKRFNPSLRAATDEGAFVSGILEGQPEPPMYFATMKRLNRDGPPVLGLAGLPKPKELTAADIAKIDAKKVAVLDARPWGKFKAGHLPGALHAPMGNQFPTTAGSFVKDNEQIVIICEPGQLDECVRCLIRIGLDHITGHATPANVESSGAKLVQTREIDAATFIQEMQNPNAFVLDVRRASEYESGHVPGSLNIAHTRLLGHLGEVPHGKALLVHCQGGVRSAMAASLLERSGFTPTNIAGGFMAYEKAGGEVVRDMAGVA